MKIHIAVTEKSSFQTGSEIKVFTDGGQEIKGILDLTINFDPNSITTATITVPVYELENLRDIEGIVIIKSGGGDDNN